MKITHYLYNAFVIEAAGKKIAIDPGGLFFYYFRFTTLIPKSEWPDITHILVTHGDPDHYWHADRVAKASQAPFICNRTMINTDSGEQLLLGPRSKGLSFDTRFDNVVPIDVDQEIDVEGIRLRGIKTTHGTLILKLGSLATKVEPGPNERIGWGSIGYSIQVDGKHIVNLGDTLLHTSEWENIRQPDVLMIPIGGKTAHNTMDEQEALQAVEAMQPRLVIPCHYNCPGLFSRKYNPADVMMFKRGVQKLGAECAVLGSGESVTIDW